MSRLEIFKDMIGESHSEFVADSLKETYKLLILFAMIKIFQN